MSGSGPERGRVLLFTGDGKGKTTAALGLVLRAVGQGLRCFVGHFVKSDASSGEMQALASLPGVTVELWGRGFLPASDDPRFDHHRQAAQQGLARARIICRSGDYDLVVLDEICVALSKSLVAESEVLEMIDQRQPAVHLALTGRGAPTSVIDRADTVTEMRCLKHAFERGRQADPGIEY